MRSSFELLLKRTGVSVERSAYLILVFLNQAGQARLTDIADAIGIDLSTLSRQAAILEQRGLVTREIDPADGRQRILQPTAEGEVVLGKIAAAHHDFLEETFEGWSEQDRKMLSVLLDRLANDVDQFLEDSLPDPS